MGNRRTRRDGAEGRNTTRYEACREFSGESTIRFDAVEEAPGPAAAARVTAYPARVRLTVALMDNIDSAKAAAADAIKVRVMKCAAPAGKAELPLPAGAVIHGRLVRMAHFLHNQPSFFLPRVRQSGSGRPLAALRCRAGFPNDAERFRHYDQEAAERHLLPVVIRKAHRHTRRHIRIRHRRAQLIIPAGTESKWITVTR
jgi:hypothetical protein